MSRQGRRATRLPIPTSHRDETTVYINIIVDFIYNLDNMERGPANTAVGHGRVKTSWTPTFQPTAPPPVPRQVS